MTTNIEDLMRYENGDMTETEAVEMFADLVKTGMAWSLQGSYGRGASSLIRAGVISPEGEVTEHGQALIDAAV